MPDAPSPATDKWYLIPTTYVDEATGTLGVLEYGQHVPFIVRRVFWVFAVPGPDVVRGAHAHNELQQVIFCAKGRCLIDLEDSSGARQTVELKEHGPSLFLNGLVWRTMREFSPDCAMVVLCDREYSLDRVVRDRSEFQQL